MKTLKVNDDELDIIIQALEDYIYDISDIVDGPSFADDLPFLHDRLTQSEQLYDRIIS